MAKRKFNLKRLEVGSLISEEQVMLGTLFGHGGKTLFNSPDSESLPRLDGVLISGNGLINNEDYGETGSMFGI